MAAASAIKGPRCDALNLKKPRVIGVRATISAVVRVIHLFNEIYVMMLQPGNMGIVSVGHSVTDFSPARCTSTLQGLPPDATRGR